MTNRKLHFSLFICSAFALSVASACNANKDGEEMGTFELRLTDAPLDDIDEVLVTFDEVAVRRCITEDDEDKKDEKTGDDEDDKKKTGDGDKKKEEDFYAEDDSSTGEDSSTGKGSETGDSSTSESDTDSADSTSGTDDKTETDDKTDTKDDDKDKDKDKDGDSPDSADEPKAPKCTKTKWMVLSEEEMTFDLLKLRNGKTKAMATKDIPAGYYTEIRLKLTKAEVVEGKDSTEVKVPSGSSSGLKIKTVFEVKAGKESGLTVDFDAGASFTRGGNGKWILKPVLKAIKSKKEEDNKKDKEEDSE